MIQDLFANPDPFAIKTYANPVLNLKDIFQMIDKYDSQIKSSTKNMNYQIKQQDPKSLNDAQENLTSINDISHKLENIRSIQIRLENNNFISIDLKAADFDTLPDKFKSLSFLYTPSPQDIIDLNNHIDYHSVKSAYAKYKSMVQKYNDISSQIEHLSEHSNYDSITHKFNRLSDILTDMDTLLAYQVNY